MSKTILKERAQDIGVEKTGNLNNCGNCGGIKVVAELNKIPMCGNCFEKTLATTISQVQIRPHGGLNPR